MSDQGKCDRVVCFGNCGGSVCADDNHRAQWCRGFYQKMPSDRAQNTPQEWRYRSDDPNASMDHCRMNGGGIGDP
jgi:hypothetical protein